MKKTLLLGAALMLGFAGYSQSAKVKVAGLKLHKTTGSTLHKIINEKPTGTPVAAKGNGNHNNTPSSGCSSIKLSSSYASSGIGDISTAGNSSNRNFLTYNKDLNMMVFVHRASNDWHTETPTTADPAGYSLGGIQAVWFPAGNPGTQDSMILYRSSTNTVTTGNVNSFRYPAGTIFNPAGNTDIRNSFIVTTGIDLSADYVGVCYAVAQPSLTAADYTPPQFDQKVCMYGTAPFGNCGGFNGGTVTAIAGSLLFDDMQQAGNQVVVAAPLQDATVTTTSGLGVKGAMVAHAKPVGGTLVWTVDSLIPGMYLVAASNPNVVGGDPTAGDGYEGSMKPRMAFSPDGTVGYVVICGRLAQSYGNSADSMISPIVYKTADGGLTWNTILVGYDWRKAHPEVLRGVGMRLFKYGTGLNWASSTPATPRYFNFNDDGPDGSDLAVDANGTLHFVCPVTYVGSDGNSPDSLSYSYGDTTNYDYVNHRPLIWDFMTDGSCWKTMLVDSINTEYCSGGAEYSNSFSNWGLASPQEFEGQGAHIQVSRSTDGNKIFYGWADSDPFGLGYANTSTGLIFNVYPDLVMKGYDITTQKMSAKIDITNGNEATYYPFLSDISYVDGNSNWVVPAIYVPEASDAVTSGPQGQIWDVNGSINYKYNSCYTFAESDFTHTANIGNDLITPACALGIKSNNSNAFASSINNYPNPFNNTTTISVTLSENKAVDVKIYNAIGNLVYSKKVNGNVGQNEVSFDGSALSSGVYYYTVTSGNEQATKKMIIQK